MNTRVVYATSHDGVRVACSIRGSGFPLLFLGLPPMSHASLQSPFAARVGWAARMAATHTLISVDLRGTGLADRHCRTHTFDAYVEDMVATLDALGITTTDVMAAGVRSGVGIRFAARYPARVRRLYLQAVTVGQTAAAGRPLVEPAARNFAAQDFDAYLESLASRLISSEANVTQFTSYMRRCTDQVSLLAALDALNREDVRDDISRIRCPVLVTELSDNTLITPGHAEAFLKLVPHAELALVPNRPLFEWLDDQIDAMERFDAKLDAAEGHPVRAELSQRETEVLALLAAGHTNAEIATALTLSKSTVDRHVANIYTKINVRNRAEATRWALTHGIDPARLANSPG